MSRKAHSSRSVASRAGLVLGASAALCLGVPALATDPFADAVVAYEPGIGTSVLYQNPAVALGSPGRLTGDNSGFAGTVTPFAAPFEADEIVSVGRGGLLTLRFDEPITNDAQNPFGIDLLVFGNSFFYNDNFEPIADALWQPGGRIEVSADGVDWRTIVGVNADGAFPTLGYSDETSPFGGAVGQLPTDFTKPVNPAFAWQGLGLTDLIAGYAGSGGGAGVDIASVGLESVQFVRVSLALDAAVSKIEIDGLSDVAVPAPGTLLMALSACWPLRRRRTHACG